MSVGRVVLCWLVWLTASALAAGSAADAEKPALDLPPMPVSYVNDLAHVLSGGARAQMEAECVALHTQANAEVAVVVMPALPDGVTAAEFTAALEEKWKLGKTGSDRGLIFLLVVKPPAERIETGYGLEAVLPDAKDGRILDDVVPLSHSGQWDLAAEKGLSEIADAIAADAHVTLAPMASVASVDHPQDAPPAGSGDVPNWQVALVLCCLAGFLYLLYRLGLLGPILFLLQLFGSLSGDDEGGGGGGGFGGSGGGASGGGGASRD